MNLISSYIDGNMIYGSDVERNKILRTLSKGKMKVWEEEMLPVCAILKFFSYLIKRHTTHAKVFSGMQEFVTIKYTLYVPR